LNHTLFLSYESLANSTLSPNNPFFILALCRDTQNCQT